MGCCGWAKPAHNTPSILFSDRYSIQAGTHQERSLIAVLISLLTAAAPLPVLAGLGLCIGFLYASFVFGGASGDLAVMSQFSIPPAPASCAALSLNVVV